METEVLMINDTQRKKIYTLIRQLVMYKDTPKDLFWSRQEIDDLTEDEANAYIDKLSSTLEQYKQ